MDTVMDTMSGIFFFRLCLMTMPRTAVGCFDSSCSNSVGSLSHKMIQYTLGVCPLKSSGLPGTAAENIILSSAGSVVKAW